MKLPEKTTPRLLALIGAPACLLAFGTPLVRAQVAPTPVVDAATLVRFDTRSVLEKGGDGLDRNASNPPPVEATDARVRQGMLEGSNVNTIAQITKMLEVTRAYESMAQMMDSTATLSRDSISRLGKVQ